MRPRRRWHDRNGASRLGVTCRPGDRGRSTSSCDPSVSNEQVITEGMPTVVAAFGCSVYFFCGRPRFNPRDVGAASAQATYFAS